MKRKWTDESLRNFRSYQSDFIKKNYKAFSFRLNKEEDKELIEYLKNQKNLTDYIRNLVKEDIKNKK